MKVLVTGGAGFVGSSLATRLKYENPNFEIVCLDNLKRRGSELNVNILRNNGIEFLHGDVRCVEDIESLGGFDLMLECSAEPSVMAGIGTSPKYLLETNLTGTLNCLEACRTHNAAIIFLSTSRVYPIATLNSLTYKEDSTRFELLENQNIPGASWYGISEDFPLAGVRSLYGTTKLASELVIAEYGANYGINFAINRCGLIAGPGQFGKSDQGIVTHWLTSHAWKKKLKYIGYGGMGKQVRDVLHIEDLYELISMQVSEIDRFNGQTFNAGGGDQSVSLLELTQICSKITGNSISISHELDDRVGDIRIYKTDNRKITKFCEWQPKRSVLKTVEDIYEWLVQNERKLKEVLM